MERWNGREMGNGKSIRVGEDKQTRKDKEQRKESAKRVKRIKYTISHTQTKVDKKKQLRTACSSLLGCQCGHHTTPPRPTEPISARILVTHLPQRSRRICSGIYQWGHSSNAVGVSHGMPCGKDSALSPAPDGMPESFQTLCSTIFFFATVESTFAPFAVFMCVCFDKTTAKINIRLCVPDIHRLRRW